MSSLNNKKIERNSKGQFVKGVYLGFGFKKGAQVWNKGKKGIHLSPKTEFKKGMKPWNLGKKGVQTNKNKGKSNGYIDSHGYKVYYMNGKELKEHRQVMEKIVGRKLSRKEVVHHKNHNRADNRIENLEVMSLGEHTRLHKLNQI